MATAWLLSLPLSQIPSRHFIFAPLQTSGPSETVFPKTITSSLVSFRYFDCSDAKVVNAVRHPSASTRKQRKECGAFAQVTSAWDVCPVKSPARPPLAFNLDG